MLCGNKLEKRTKKTKNYKKELQKFLTHLSCTIFASNSWKQEATINETQYFNIFYNEEKFWKDSLVY